MKHMLLAGVVMLAALNGSALAGALDEPDNMAPFYTDVSTKTLKSHDEMRAAWYAMPMEKRSAMMRECQDAAMSKPYAEFCENLMPFGGPNK
ncbi:MAG: hypothetical protein E5W15_12585 [Mesorhizobium sp.]|uniref:hypothetical protein n=1 Tax=Mesorhizobium sp. TaxID=1871066 RepID=UPI000FE9AC2B|nr:hypothetical protein [Mesorhizobium sp.]RWB40289.1 MAG: hypothetical protein EOQ46_25120 [Mesorhizobium sp.]RWB57901.1 MAG: hypothetical protein EOQ48_24210 [Mesorhizobium sp.]RWB82125.1 MAG: hypothetical protein EOQ51_24730 [Mesorhizobium sp.]RWD75814.1 MAG: hypothetical protein EOS60_06830 [Mesorhizobium sp.]TIU71440.1 MAG: hypothetical protein E5W15_12585 [Mesorhizobium sp.]